MGFRGVWGRGGGGGGGGGAGLKAVQGHAGLSLSSFHQLSTKHEAFVLVPSTLFIVPLVATPSIS